MVKGIRAIAISGFLLLILGQNCTGVQMTGPAVEPGSLDSSSLGTSGTPESKPSGKALLNFEQVYQSMLNLTGQNATATRAQSQAFQAVTGALPEGANLSLVTGSSLLATNSLAGEVCNGLIAREEGQGADQRSFFKAVDFGQTPSALAEADYLSAAGRMAQMFWSRPLDGGETALLKSYRQDFVSGLSGADQKSARQTRNLILSTCAAMLSSFETFTY